jgi:hypothetical protein
MKCITKSLKASLFLVLFGVCSVSLEAQSYPVKKSPYSLSNQLQSSQSETIRLSRSARESSQKEYSSKTQPIATRGPLAPGTHNISLGVGQVFLLGKLGNNYENAIGTQLNYTYGVSELFSFESNFGYSSHSSGNLSLGFLSAGLRTNLLYFDQLVPFFNLGLGFYRPSQTLVTTNATVSALLFGLQLGGGIDLLITERMFFGSRITYHNMFSSTKKDSAGVNYNVGGAFASFLLHVGFNF